MFNALFLNTFVVVIARFQRFWDVCQSFSDFQMWRSRPLNVFIIFKAFFSEYFCCRSCKFSQHLRWLLVAVRAAKVTFRCFPSCKIGSRPSKCIQNFPSICSEYFCCCNCKVPLVLRCLSVVFRAPKWRSRPRNVFRIFEAIFLNSFVVAVTSFPSIWSVCSCLLEWQKWHFVVSRAAKVAFQVSKCNQNVSGCTANLEPLTQPFRYFNKFVQ